MKQSADAGSCCFNRADWFVEAMKNGKRRKVSGVSPNVLGALVPAVRAPHEKAFLHSNLLKRPVLLKNY
jgi:hypothetical protein